MATRRHIGFQKRSHENWEGKFYPANTKDADTLDFYESQFNTLEFNAPHYKFFPDTQYQQRLIKVEGYDLTFCPKFPQTISHNGKITALSKAVETALFLIGVITLKGKLGPAFLQISDFYAAKSKQELLDYLHALPR